MENLNSVVVSREKITVDAIVDSFKNGLKEAQLRQLINTAYPSAIISNELQDSLYSKEELGVKDKVYTNARVAWIPVAEGKTAEEVQEDLDKHVNACLYRIISHHPITNRNQKRVIQSGLSGTAFEDFKETHSLDKEEWDEECSKIVYDLIEQRQLVVYGEGNDQGKDADEPILFNGKKQYKIICFSMTSKKDEDRRGEEKQDIPSMEIAHAEEKETAGVKQS